MTNSFAAIQGALPVSPAPVVPAGTIGPTAATGLPSERIAYPAVPPVRTLYEQEIANSKTVPGPYARAFYDRGVSDEPLVRAQDYGIDGTSYYAIKDGSNPPYDRPLPGAQATVWVRQSVAKRLQRVNALLRPYGYELYIRDGWRSPRTQRAIFATFESAYKAAHPEASDAQARAHALIYASDPVFSPDDPASVPLHATGGAVDVTLSRIGTHMPIDLGAPFDDTTDRAHTAYFETHAPQNADERFDKWARELLNGAMLGGAGMSNYPDEYWHYDFKDRMYARYLDLERANAPAGEQPYGYIEPPTAAPAA